jgi:hypothetical protein
MVCSQFWEDVTFHVFYNKIFEGVVMELSHSCEILYVFHADLKGVFHLYLFRIDFI